MSHYSDKQKFLEFYQNLSFKNPISEKVSTPVIKNPSEWFDTVEEIHQPLREKLGGVSKIIEVDLSSEELTSYVPSYITVKSLCYRIGDLLPAMFSKFDLDSSDFQSPFYGPRKMKWGRFIGAWMTEHKTSKETVDAVNKVLAELGAIWALYKVIGKKTYMNISTDPMAFVKIGHYGADGGSCFGLGGLNEINKYMIGQTPNSFVGLIGFAEHEVDLMSTSVRTRFWGFAEDDYKCFHTSNIYPRTPTHNGDIVKAMEKAFQTLIGEKTEVSNNRLVVHGVYQNGHSGRSYHTVGHPISRIVEDLRVTQDGLQGYSKCMYCGKTQDELGAEIKPMHLGQYCPKCIERYAGDGVCPVSGEYAYSGETVNHPDLGKVKLSLKVLLRDFPHCEFTNKRRHISEMRITTENTWIHKDSLEQYGFTICTVCDKAYDPKETSCCSKSQLEVTEEVKEAEVVEEVVAAAA